MNDTIQFSREIAVKAIGSTWYVDKAINALVENLGRKVPPSAFADISYSTFEDAIAENDLPVVPLPDLIRMPAGSALEMSTRVIPQFSQKILLLNEQDFLGKGLFLEEVAITFVEYDFVPSHLAGRFDSVAAYAYGERKGGDKIMVHLEYDVDGNIVITEAPMALGATGWVPLENITAFLNQADAEAAATEKVQALIVEWQEKLTTAIDWKANTERLAA